MIHTLATDAIIPISLIKTLLAALTLWVWAAWAVLVNKDAGYFNQKQRMWNAAQLAAAAIGFLALFFIPIFIVGWVLALALMGGAGTAYAMVRNKAVAEKDRWRLDKEFLLKTFMNRRQERAEKHATLKFKSAAGAPADLKPVPLPSEERYEVHLRAEEVLDAALARRAQAVNIVGGDSGFAVTLSVDGVDHKHSQLSANEGLRVVDYLKAHCGMDLADRRKQLTGTCKVDSAANGSHEMKVQTAGSPRGVERIVRFDPLKQVNMQFNELGLLEQQAAALQPVIDTHKGLILVACPPHQGRTTTLYALAQCHDPYTMDIHTLEQTPERPIESVTQHTVEAADVPKKLRSLLLRDPHVVAVMNVADPQAAKMIAEAAGDMNKRFYAGLKADDTFSALKLWIKAVGDPELAAKGLSGVISQRLVRKLCTVCRQKYKPDVTALKKLNLPADKIKELYKAGGKVVIKNEPETCPACFGIGYMGRFAAFEVLVLDEEARKLIAAGDLNQLRAHVRRQRTLWLEEAALAKVVNGTTSIAECMRAMTGEGAAGEAPKPEAAAKPAAVAAKPAVGKPVLAPKPGTSAAVKPPAKPVQKPQPKTQKPA